jgi:hypothetical protein
MIDALCLSLLYQVKVCDILVKSLGLSLPCKVISCELCLGVCYVYGNNLACVWRVPACLMQVAALILFTTGISLSLPYTAAPSYIY